MPEKPDYIKVLKIAAGTSISILLAELLGLKYTTSAGVITLLSIQDTKKETLRVVVRRLASFVLALALSFAAFSLFGYDVFAVGVFLILFTPLCIAFHMQEGISVNTVLILHFLADRSMTVRDMGNELALLIVGAGMGILLNLYIPGKGKEIKDKQGRIEERMREILNGMALMLLPGDHPAVLRLESSLSELDAELERGEKSAYEEMENQLLSETKYYIRYMNMRKVQAGVLGRIRESLGHLSALPPQAGEIAKLMRRISGSFHEYNNALALLEETEQVKQSMRERPLPLAREEFENRAVLFLILKDLEQFLDIKREFVEELTEEEIGKFWADGR